MADVGAVSYSQILFTVSLSSYFLNSWFFSRFAIRSANTGLIVKIVSVYTRPGVSFAFVEARLAEGRVAEVDGANAPVRVVCRRDFSVRSAGIPTTLR